MRIIVAGSRTLANHPWIDGPSLVRQAIHESQFAESVIVAGGADGPDSWAKEYARQEPLPFVEYPAEWDKYGKSAGPRRNVRMSENGDALVALWDGSSSGTRHMIETAKEKNLKCYIKTIQVHRILPAIGQDLPENVTPSLFD